MDRVQELIAATGALLIFLPPYSPDLNPIEVRLAPSCTVLHRLAPSCAPSWTVVMRFAWPPPCLQPLHGTVAWVRRPVPAQKGFGLVKRLMQRNQRAAAAAPIKTLYRMLRQVTSKQMNGFYRHSYPHCGLLDEDDVAATAIIPALVSAIMLIRRKRRREEEEQQQQQQADAARRKRARAAQQGGPHAAS